VTDDNQVCPHCHSDSLQKRGLTKAEEPKQQYACNECGKWFLVSLVEIDDDKEFTLTKSQIAALERKDRFFVTCSQNNTPVDRGFWSAIEHYRAENGSELLIPPIRYKNPTSRFDAQDDDNDVWWPDEVVPFLCESIVKIHPELWVMGNMRIQATATNPLTGLETISHNASAIYGHNQLQMKTIPTPQQDLPKQLWASGSCSVQNYSKTKAGVKGEHHHTIAGLVIEKKGKKFHIRPVIWDGECFYDLDKKYTVDGVERNQRISALVTGDEHALFNCPDVKAATYTNKDSISAVLKPEVVVRHDVFDGYSISHHHRNNPLTQYVKWREGVNKVEDELQATIDYICETTPAGTTNIIVASNHNEHLYRWLKEVDWKLEPWNAKIFHWFWYHMLDEAGFGEAGAFTFDPFAYWAEQHMDPKCSTKFLERDESYVVNRVELSLHGDLGPNGSRGSAANLNKIGIRSIIGHSHSPCIEKGVVQVGTSSYLKLEYTSGPSSWMNSHALVYKNGKRALVNVLDGGEWRG
jgi:hypothetical protein